MKSIEINLSDSHTLGLPIAHISHAVAGDEYLTVYLDIMKELAQHHPMLNLLEN